MARMTEEEVTKNPPKVSGNGSNGFFMKNKDHIIVVDDLSTDWLRIKAAAEHTTEAAVINELIRKEITAALPA
ncbi:hypothetical protein AGMMS49546_36590 [Spirochaetia bacterium]|nr:hypothetical protein AGMMS49546_36590 [Spirochaetia bacterium]